MEEPQFLCWFGFLYSDYNYSSSTLQQSTGEQKQPKRTESCVEDTSDTADARQQSRSDQNDAASFPSSPKRTWCSHVLHMITRVVKVVMQMIRRIVDWLSANARPGVVAAWDVVIHATTVLLTVSSVYGVYGMHEYYQVLLLSAIFAAYLSAMLWWQPFKGFMQHVQVFVTSVLLCTCMCILALIPPEGLDARQREIMDEVSLVFAYLILVGNALCAGVLLVLLVLAVSGRCRDQFGSIIVALKDTSRKSNNGDVERTAMASAELANLC